MREFPQRSSVTQGIKYKRLKGHYKFRKPKVVISILTIISNVIGSDNGVGLWTFLIVLDRILNVCLNTEESIQANLLPYDVIPQFITVRKHFEGYIK